jgi:hypothetical protein
MRVWMRSAIVVSVRPATIGGRGPIRSASRPASGAITTIMSVEGRKRTPASTAE